MTRKLILHIGHPKTGSTTLQTSLQAWRPMLAERGILHPDTGSHYNHKTLLPYLLHGSDPKRAGPDVAEFEKRWRAVLTQIDAQDPHTIILSSEQLFRRKDSTEMVSLSSHLKRLASEIVVVAYLREPSALCLSAAQQQIKHRPFFKIRDCGYFRASLEPYQSSGLGRMNVRVFARDKLQQGCIVHDFFGQNLPEFDVSGLPQPTDRNISMSAEAMSLLQEIHRGERRFSIAKPHREILKADQKLDGFTRPRMHAHVRSAIQARRADLNWLHEQFDVQFPDIDCSAMPIDEANRIIAGLDLVKDICPVDEERKGELWAVLTRKESMLARLLGPA